MKSESLKMYRVYQCRYSPRCKKRPPRSMSSSIQFSRDFFFFFFFFSIPSFLSLQSSYIRWRNLLNIGCSGSVVGEHSSSFIESSVHSIDGRLFWFPYLALKLRSPRDGKAIFFLETQDNPILSWLAPFLSYHIIPERRKKHLYVAGREPRWASTTSRHSIHNTMASSINRA